MALPNASNDFIFAVIGEEFGLVGGGIVIALFLILAYQGVRISLAAPDTFGALLAAGITAWLCVQAFINIAVVVALIPSPGSPCRSSAPAARRSRSAWPPSESCCPSRAKP